MTLYRHMLDCVFFVGDTELRMGRDIGVICEYFYILTNLHFSGIKVGWSGECFVTLQPKKLKEFRIDN